MKKNIVYFIILPIIILILYSLKMYDLYNDKKIWLVDNCEDPKITKKRMQQRSIFLSIVGVINLIVYSIYKSCKINPSIILKTYTYLLGPVLSFLIHGLYYTNEGLTIVNEDIFNIKYFLGLLSTNTFYRYFIVVLIDMFISIPLISRMKDIIKPLLIKKNDSIITSILSNNIEKILIIVVKVLSHFTYLEKLRLNWIFPNKNYTEKDYYPTILIVIFTLISGTIFINKTTKLIDLILFIFSLLIIILGNLDIINLNPNEEIKNKENQSKKLNIENKYLITKNYKNGLKIFSIILFIGFVIPMFNNKLKNNKGNNLKLISILIFFIIIYFLYYNSNKKKEIPKGKKKCKKKNN